MDNLEKTLTRSIDKILPSREELEGELKKRTLSVYHGIDPTGPDLHLGHLSSLLVAKRFSELGQKITILFGDFTAQIGDPSGREVARKPLTEKEVKNNLAAYKGQIKKVFGKESRKIKFAYNSKWLRKLDFSNVIDLASKVTVQQMIERDMFQRRIEDRNPIGLHEFLYPLMQGYDSYALMTDVEIGGNDQLFNMMMGRTLQADLSGKKKQKFVITTKLLEDPETGRKMSKSEGFYVSLSAKPNDLYGKIMRLPDSIVPLCFELCTEVDMKEVEKLAGMHPKETKSRLAFEITAMLYGSKKAERARKEFERIFQEGGFPEEAETIRLDSPKDIISVLADTGIVLSKSEARKLVDGGGIELDGKVIKDWNTRVDPEKHRTIKIGKHRFVKIVK